MYAPIAARLRAHYEVVVVERRGYAPSGDGPRPGTFAQQAEDIAAVLAHVGAPAFVFGHSAGALATLHALPGAGDRIRAAALYEAPFALAGAPLRPVLAHCRALLDAGRGADAVAEFLTATSEPDETLPISQIAMMFASRARGLVEDLECVTSMSPEPAAWSGVDVPVQLLIGSKSDQVARDSTALLESALPDHETVELPGQAHQPDDPELVATTLHTFFGRHQS
jgi:pimeloyl-ACP methyl ester carboxylesterase